jgi:hypothetical protein
LEGAALACNTNIEMNAKKITNRMQTLPL